MDINDKIRLFKTLARNFDSMDYPPIQLWRPVGRRRIRQGWLQRTREVRSGEADCPGLYVHIPYCQAKCFFCKFRVRAGNSQALHSRYLSCLNREIREFAPLVRGLSFKTLYLGGGTPTILSAEQLDRLFSVLERNFNLSETAQRLIESTPATLSREKFRILKKHGFDRITIGVQVTDPRLLVSINRRNQTLKMVEDSFRQAREAGIETVNTDLVAGLPGQTASSFLKDVRLMLKMRPDALHLFPYEEEELVIYYMTGRRLTHAGRVRRDRMLRLADREILKRGYRPFRSEPYLLSPRAANLQFQYRYLYNGSLLGLGAEALSYIPDHFSYENSKLEEYLEFWSKKKAPPFLNGHALDRKETRLNYVLNNIRAGLDCRSYFRRYGLEFKKEYQRELEELAGIGRIREEGERITLSAGDDLEFRAYSKFFYTPAVMKRLGKKAERFLSGRGGA